MSLHHEIERKYLVDALPVDLGAWPSQDIEQGYIAIEDDGTEVRVRRVGERAVLTVKKGGGLVRVEEEIPLDSETFDRLWPLTEGRRVVKTRHAVEGDAGLLIEVDVFSGALEGLVLAEVEFPTVGAADAFQAPPWMGREVTGDPGYKNQSLAVMGAPRHAV